MLKWILAGVVVVIVVAAGVWTTQCPCDRISGAWLQGETATEAVEDWSFANDAGLCYIEVPGVIPHSVTLNCMSASTQLYLSCARCDGKRWSTTAVETGTGRIRIDAVVYPVSMSRVTNAAELDLAWAARAAKTARMRGQGGDVEVPPRPDHWWSFRLESRG